MDELILEPKYLDAVYREWLLKDRASAHKIKSRWFLRENYQRKYRHGFNEQRFEEWLYRHGFTVFQREGKRYLRTTENNSKVTLFLLKYGVTA